MSRWALCGLAALAVAGQAAAQPLEVGPGRAHATIGGALAAAADGDTVRVASGVYRERLVVERAVTLLGEGWPVVDGGGAGHVVEATAPIAISGFVLRGSGRTVEAEHAGVMVRGARAEVVGNRIEDVLYGVYLKESPGSRVAANRIEGKPLAPPRRGDGIRLWYSPDSRIEENEVVGTRDVVVYFSDRLLLRGNRIRDGRYGLHTMYSNDGRIEGNRLSANHVGAFLMYSKGLEVADNVFHRAEGASGMGLGLKDADDITVEGNLFLENVTGIHLDNSPRGRDAANRIAANAFVGNAVGVRLLPSVAGNRFEANDLVGNGRPVEVAGGARAGLEARNDWVGNHWDDYAGFDRDGDGTGDTPHLHARLADELMARHPGLEIFAGSPAFALLELIARFFPLLQPEPVAVDPAPRTSTAAIDRWAGTELPGVSAPPSPVERAGAGAGWALVALVAVAALRRAAGRRP